MDVCDRTSLPGSGGFPAASAHPASDRGAGIAHDVSMPVPTLVLLHGQPDTSASFWALRAELGLRLPAGVRTLAPDRPGYGANPLPATDYRGNVRWLQGWLRHIDAGPVVLVGHSWAGGVAALAAAGEIDRPAGLVLLASVGPKCLVPIDPVLAAPVLGEIIAYTTLRIGRPFLALRAATVIHGAQPPMDRPYARTSGAAMRHRRVWRSFLTEQRALMDDLPDIDAALPAITVPTLILHGDKDPVIPMRTPLALAEAIPGARRHQIAGGHDLQLRQPAAAAAVIAPFAAGLLP